MTRLSDIKAGDEVETDDRFTCMMARQHVVLADSKGNLFLQCYGGRHYLDRQVDDETGVLVGIAKVE